MIQPHRHHTGGRALRLLLARFRGGPLDELECTNILIDELTDCDGCCWFVIADQLADMLKREVVARIAEHPGATLDDYIRWLEQRLIAELDRDVLDELDDEDAA